MNNALSGGESSFQIALQFNNLAIYVFDDDLKFLIAKTITKSFPYLIKDLNVMYIRDITDYVLFSISIHFIGKCL